MAFHPFEVSIPHIAYACLGGFVVIFGMFSLFIREKLYIGEACWAFLFGVIIGPYGANIFDPRGWAGQDPETVNTITLEATRVVLAIGVFAIGVELPKQYMKRHWRSLAFLLIPIMTWGWFVSAGLIFALIPKLNFLSSLVVASCLTPTDPILAAAVVGGKYADKHVPAHLRHLLAAESGCNDGAAFPFLFISLYLVLDKGPGAAVKDWFLQLWLYQIALGVVFGSLVGIGFRHLMKYCERTDLIDRQSYVAQYVSLALLTIGTTTLLGSDDLLSTFACGSAFAWDGFFNRQTEESVFSSVIDLLFNVAAFVFVGAWMPFNQFTNAATSVEVWRLVVIAILVLLLRRLPAMVALYPWIPDVKTFREAVFSGHFGPIGIGAVFISTLAAEQLPKPSDPPASQEELLAATIQPIVAFMVLVSIAVHGLSIPFFSLGRRVHSLRTWSRRGTQETTPEWATQVRHANRAEDIVVNRDDALERGDYLPEGDEVDQGSEREGSGSEKTMSESAKEKEREREKDNSPEVDSKVPEDAYTPEGEDVRKENAPDGDDILSEWREGPHRIIERRAGPSEEVEVEVQRNAFAPSDRPGHDNTTVSVFRGEHAAARDTARGYLDKISQDVHHAEHRALEGVEHVIRTLSPTRPHAHARHSSTDTDVPLRGRTSVSEQAEARAGAGGGASDDEEGWASDPEGERSGVESDAEPVSPASLISPAKPASRKRASTGTSTSTSGSNGTGTGTGMERTTRSRARTRQRPVQRPSQLHVDRVRASDAQERRTASPSRSVRFIDSPSGTPGFVTPAGYATPVGIPGTPRSGTPPLGEEAVNSPDSARGKVSFDLSRLTRH